MTTTALSLLKTSTTVAARAESFEKTIRRNIQREVLDTLIADKEKYEQKLFELQDFSLETDLNAGQRRMTADDCETRFKEMINIEFRLTMLDLEIKVKQESFNKYFPTV